MAGEPDEIELAELEWDDDNEEHLLRHEVARRDVEAALAGQPQFFRNLPGRSGSHVMIGIDGRGRVLLVSLVAVGGRGRWRPITAWESRYARRIYQP